MTEERIGILYTGELGSALGALLLDQGHEVLTTLEGRSSKTARRCHEAGITVVDSLAEVAARATMVWSIVHPDCAREMSERYLTVVSAAPSSRIYIDVNSIEPARAKGIAMRVGQAGVEFVDASIHGDAGRLRERSVLYLSGERADRVERSLGGAMRVRRLGSQVGAASQLKMTLTGVSKGLCALFMEVASVAQGQNLLEPWVEECRHFYPEIMERLDRMLPTYAGHARRRAKELEDLERSVRDLGLRPGMIAETRRLISLLASHHEDESIQWCVGATTSLEEFLHAITAVDLLRTSADSIEPKNPSSREEPDHGHATS